MEKLLKLSLLNAAISSSLKVYKKEPFKNKKGSYDKKFFRGKIK